MTNLLEIDKLHAWYGNNHVLHGISLHVAAGEIVSLLGRNGAGRSTTVKAIMGMTQATGAMHFHGESILGLPTFEIARRGIGYVAESRDVFPMLSVEQNLLLGEKRGARQRWNTEDMYRLFPHLDARRAVQAGMLSGGEQQMLALARCMMGNPELVLVDEPTEGLAPQMVALIAEFIKEMAWRGVAVLLIEQKLSIALRIAQRVYLMGHGQIVHHGTPQSLHEQPALYQEWLAV